jgi:peptidoglycan/LPS O-acetylase OafA/YrhL
MENTEAAFAASRSEAQNLARLTIAVVLFLGLFWIGLGLLQFGMAFTTPDNSRAQLFVLGIWNIFNSIFVLASVPDIRKRHKVALKNLGTYSVFGFFLAFFGVANGAWLLICIAGLYVLLGILLVMNKDYFTQLTPKEIKKLQELGQAEGAT